MVATGASDAQYHVMWIAFFNAVDDYGIRGDSHPPNDVQTVKKKVYEEALHASLRVSALVSKLNPLHLLLTALGVCVGGRLDVKWVLGRCHLVGESYPLTSSHPQKLDTAVMHVSIIQAGTLLARLGRPEVHNCIEGLQQYSYAYEETREKANQMQRDYDQTMHKGPCFNEMHSAIPRVQQF